MYKNKKICVATHIIKVDGVDTPKLIFYSGDKMVQLYQAVLRKDIGEWVNTLGFEMEADASYYV